MEKTYKCPYCLSKKFKLKTIVRLQDCQGNKFTKFKCLNPDCNSVFCLYDETSKLIH